MSDYVEEGASVSAEAEAKEALARQVLSQSQSDHEVPSMSRAGDL